MRARAAVKQIGEIQSVSTDMEEHTLSVSFDTDQVSLDSVIDALNGAGYHVPGYRQLN